jgi:hypothetical protein
VILTDLACAEQNISMLSPTQATPQHAVIVAADAMLEAARQSSARSASLISNPSMLASTPAVAPSLPFGSVETETLPGVYGVRNAGAGVAFEVSFGSAVRPLKSTRSVPPSLIGKPRVTMADPAVSAVAAAAPTSGKPKLKKSPSKKLGKKKGSTRSLAADASGPPAPLASVASPRADRSRKLGVSASVTALPVARTVSALPVSVRASMPAEPARTSTPPASLQRAGSSGRREAWVDAPAAAAARGSPKRSLSTERSRSQGRARPSLADILARSSPAPAERRAGAAVDAALPVPSAFCSAARPRDLTAETEPVPSEASPGRRTVRAVVPAVQPDIEPDAAWAAARVPVPVSASAPLAPAAIAATPAVSGRPAGDSRTLPRSVSDPTVPLEPATVQPSARRAVSMSAKAYTGGPLSMSQLQPAAIQMRSSALAGTVSGMGLLVLCVLNLTRTAIHTEEWRRARATVQADLVSMVLRTPKGITDEVRLLPTLRRVVRR